MSATETALHLGPELDHAVNRMDFFRLFKSLTTRHGFQYFGVTEILGEDQGMNFQHGHALHNFSAAWFCDARGMVIGSADPVVTYLQQSSAPCWMDIERNSCDILAASGSTSAIVVPLHAVTGKRYGLIMLGGDQRVEHQRLALIALEAAVVFQRYFEVILSLDSICGLSDRELQIVRWTSEGKTSAEIAIILGLSEHTVNSYIAAILRKLRVVNRAQMVASALRGGLIT